MSKSVESFESALAWAVDAVGGPVPAAKACGVSRQSVDKWVARGQLPRTEYTGETRYAARLAAASGGKFTAEWLLTEASPNKPTMEPEAPKAVA